MCELKALYARPSHVQTVLPARTGLFCQHVEHLLSQLPQKNTRRTKKGRSEQPAVPRGAGCVWIPLLSAGHTPASGLWGFAKRFVCHFLLSVGSDAQ